MFEVTASARGNAYPLQQLHPVHVHVLQTTAAPSCARTHCTTAAPPCAQPVHVHVHVLYTTAGPPCARAQINQVITAMHVHGEQTSSGKDQTKTKQGASKDQGRTKQGPSKDQGRTKQGSSKEKQKTFNCRHLRTAVSWVSCVMVLCSVLCITCAREREREREMHLIRKLHVVFLSPVDLLAQLCVTVLSDHWTGSSFSDWVRSQNTTDCPQYITTWLPHHFSARDIHVHQKISKDKSWGGWGNTYLFLLV